MGTTADYCIAVPVLPDQVEAYRKFGTDTEGRYKADHEAFLRRVGVERERIWLQQLPDGSALSVNHWRGDVQRFLEWTPEGDYEHLLAGAIQRMNGIDFTEAPTMNERVAAIPTPGVTARDDYTFALPILPGRLPAWREMVRRVLADTRAHQELHRATGIAAEVVFLQQAGGVDLAIYHWECDDPGAAFAATIEGPTEWGRELLGIVADVHGFDPTAPIPLNELLTSHDVE